MKCGVASLCTRESRGNALRAVLAALGRGSLIPNAWLFFSSKSGILSPGLKALLPTARQSPLREAAHFKVLSIPSGERASGTPPKKPG